jgi:hypothetical protein
MYVSHIMSRATHAHAIDHLIWWALGSVQPNHTSTLLARFDLLILAQNTSEKLNYLSRLLASMISRDGQSHSKKEMCLTIARGVENWRKRDQFPCKASHFLLLILRVGRVGNVTY